jgi:hypothetical protein
VITGVRSCRSLRDKRGGMLASTNASRATSRT